MNLETQKAITALPEIPPDYLQMRWYAAYTNARHEKRVGQQMEGNRIDCFVPLYKSVRRWKDRRKQLELPLFPGYVFVRLALKDRLHVLLHECSYSAGA